MVPSLLGWPLYFVLFTPVQLDRALADMVDEDVPPSYDEALADGAGALPGQVQGGKENKTGTSHPLTQPPMKVVTQVKYLGCCVSPAWK